MELAVEINGGFTQAAVLVVDHTNFYGKIYAPCSREQHQPGCLGNFRVVH
jgi:hypothetical protein